MKLMLQNMFAGALVAIRSPPQVKHPAALVPWMQLTGRWGPELMPPQCADSVYTHRYKHCAHIYIYIYIYLCIIHIYIYIFNIITYKHRNRMHAA